MTALPIIETQAGDISQYIPTNLISITDGQIHLEGELFHEGIRPAINVGLSVSRVGGAAQIPSMKKVGGTLKLDLSQYNDLKAFAQFGAELDPVTQKKLNRGERLVELLKQAQYSPLPVGQEVLVLLAYSLGAFDDVPKDKVRDLERFIIDEVKKSNPGVISLLTAAPKLVDSIRDEVGDVITAILKDYRSQ